jgi:hypothetical protein
MLWPGKNRADAVTLKANEYWAASTWAAPGGGTHSRVAFREVIGVFPAFISKMMT